MDEGCLVPIYSKGVLKTIIGSRKVDDITDNYGGKRRTA